MILLRIRISFTFDGELRVPIHHESMLHGLIFHSIRDPDYRDALHNRGFVYENRQFRMFCYSKLQGRYIAQEQYMIFKPPVSFLFSTHDERLIRELTSSLFTRDAVMIGTHPVKLLSIQQISQQISSHMRIRMITPVTAYSTFLLNNKKKTFYYSPKEEEFRRHVQENAVKKYAALHGVAPANPQLHIEPANIRQLRPKTVMFKNTYIKGWMGDFILRGSLELVQLIYDVGLSAKNSNGLGLFEVVHHIEGGETETCLMLSLRSGD